MMDSIAFKTLVRPKSPNTFLFAPEGLCENATPDQMSEIMDLAPEQMYQAVLDLISGEENWDIQDSDMTRGMLHFVATSRWMRYKDDVDILVLPADSGDAISRTASRLAVYSRSRVGHSDLGANAKRIKYMLERLKKMQFRA